ncbi:hypothetical protein Goarm_013876 [Gossypium armourianum]|uniref:Uncharacterized protein n=1 Tax=Gossypium armourianum TaxID=34283 RepID=A0A7J9J4H1_9ROSI|nr:hypothetical protein [Gossypium armourianum]
MSITGMSEQWVAAQIEQKGDRFDFGTYGYEEKN